MRYDLLTMLPEKAFQPVGKKMTLEGGGGGKSPQSPTAPEPVKPPDTAKTPARDPFAAGNKTSANQQGPQSTMLTGAGGVAPSSLSLGRSSVLYDNEKDKLGA